jgi:nucleotide-binding universal stress UspA family protein
MFKQIAVGVDEQQDGRDAIALARNLLAQDGELTLAHVYHGDSFFDRGAKTGVFNLQSRPAFERLAKTCRETGVEARVRWRAAPSVGQGLHDLCEQIDADLLVVGPSRRGLLGRVLIGDDTRASLKGTPCAVAIAPAGYSRDPRAIRKIGVGYDGSDESQHALELARLLAADTGASLSAFDTIVLLPARYFTAGPRPLTEAVDSVVADARAGIRALGGIDAQAAYGHPVEELTAYSGVLDLLVVGSHRHGPIERLLHRSTSRRLTRTAHCPLLVLPSSARTIEASKPMSREYATPGDTVVAATDCVGT